ncbi:MAG: hypothetical protein ABI120_03245, partial [Gemmatimonadaceae bacterium]
PLETRWEAIEEAERLFRATKLRVSTDNIGMAQLKDSTELVRIGKPIRAEFAAWRYGDQFGRRWRKYVVGSAAVAAGARAQIAVQVVNVANFANNMALHNSSSLGLAAAGVGAMSVTVLGAGFHVARRYREKRLVAVVRDDTGFALRLNQFWMDRSTVTAPAGENGWQLQLMYPREYRSDAIRYTQGNPDTRQTLGDTSISILTAYSALRALATVLPHVNRSGGGKRTVSDALAAIVEAREAADILRNAPAIVPRRSIFAAPAQKNLIGLPAPIRLALEMSLHESDEHRAMQGELKELEQRWREADAIAKIADEMFLPQSVDERMRALHDKTPDAQ